VAYTGAYDFSHTSAEWESVISLGIFGLRNRIADYARTASDPQKESFYASLLRCYDAALRFMRRAADLAIASGKSRMGESLIYLTEGSPRNLFEALQTSIIYYTLQHFFDGTYLRTLGRLDGLFYPYFVKEDRQAAFDCMVDFVSEIDRLKAPANIPFALCGTNADGEDLTNEMSYLWLDAYEAAGDISDKDTYGIYAEGISCSKYTDALFEAVVELGSTKGIFFGHDHINSLRFTYQGVTLAYGYSIDYSAYAGGTGYQRGCTVLTVSGGEWSLRYSNYYSGLYDHLDDSVNMTPTEYN
jgi:hypothetical protein